MRVGVLGARGRMGTTVCGAVESDADLVLAARLGRGDPLDALIDGSVEVAVDFTSGGVAAHNGHWCLANGIHVVVGATGVPAADLEALRERAAESGRNVFVAPNFALGAVLMMVLAARAAPFFDTAEIVERHHERKADAPSGTALRTAELMNARRERAWALAPAGDEAGARGADVAGIRIHSLRVPGSVAHQDVVLGSAGETLTIRHDSIDRASFMPGVILAIKKVPSLGALTVGLEHLLEL